MWSETDELKVLPAWYSHWYHCDLTTSVPSAPFLFANGNSIKHYGPGLKKIRNWANSLEYKKNYVQLRSAI